MNILFCSLEEGFRGISVRYMSSYIKSKGHSSKILFFNRDRQVHPSSAGFGAEEVSEFVDFIKNHKIDLVGISIMTENFLEAKDLIVKAKKNLPLTKFVLGGVHATVCPKECVETGADFVIAGDGEVPLYKLISGDDPKKINGLAFMSDNKIVINPPVPSESIDLKDLPFPDWGFEDVFFFKKDKIEGLNEKDFKAGSTWSGKYYPLTTSRGCPYHCAYCCNVNRYSIKRNSIGKIMDELEYIKKTLPFTCGLNIQDDSFYLGSDEWIAEFCRELKIRFGWPFIVRLMPRLVGEKRIEILKEGGVEFVSMGIQGSDRLNKELYDRNETSENFLTACKILRKYNIKYIIDVLLDNPYETEEDLKEIALTLSKTPKPFGVNAFSLTLFPGTKLCDKAKADGYYEKFSTDPYEGQTLQTYSFLTKLYRHEYDLGKTGKYTTPVAWRKLIYAIAPMAPEGTVKRIIEQGVLTEKSSREIDSLYKRYSVMVRFGNWFKELAPSLFVVAINIYMKIRGEKTKA
ncbi:MAG: radical SAM protein [Candidatus Nealsonbacteria bacterium]|nr:radical SAM protein [Candidatus Nealsonbacteria bacterium]